MNLHITQWSAYCRGDSYEGSQDIAGLSFADVHTGGDRHAGVNEPEQFVHSVVNIHCKTNKGKQGLSGSLTTQACPQSLELEQAESQ